MVTDAPTDSQVLEELVAAAAGGDRTAQSELLKRYWPVILQAVRARKRRLGPRLAGREETQDLQQAAAMKILARLPKHSWQGGSAFGAWVKKLSSMEAVDAHRYHRARIRDAAAETVWEPAKEPRRRGGSRSPESHFDDRRRIEDLRDEVTRLKPEYGAALMMHHMGFSHAEVGDVIGCSAEAARKLVSRARRRLLELRGEAL